MPVDVSKATTSLKDLLHAHSLWPIWEEKDPSGHPIDENIEKNKRAEKIEMQDLWRANGWSKGKPKDDETGAHGSRDKFKKFSQEDITKINDKLEQVVRKNNNSDPWQHINHVAPVPCSCAFCK